VKPSLFLALALFSLLHLAPRGEAQWGWPPPGTSTIGVRACDNSHYRGLCALLRDWRRSRQWHQLPAADHGTSCQPPTTAPAISPGRGTGYQLLPH
jgi:hypothetical protein